MGSTTHATAATLYRCQVSRRATATSCRPVLPAGLSAGRIWHSSNATNTPFVDLLANRGVVGTGPAISGCLGPEAVEVADVRRRRVAEDGACKILCRLSDYARGRVGVGLRSADKQAEGLHGSLYSAYMRPRDCRRSGTSQFCSARRTCLPGAAVFSWSSDWLRPVSREVMPCAGRVCTTQIPCPYLRVAAALGLAASLRAG